MAEISLGFIYPNGPTRATSNRDNPAAAVWVHSYRVQHAKANSATVSGYVGDSTMNGSYVSDGYYGILAPKADGATWPIYQSQRCEGLQNAINLADVYLESDEPGAGFLVTGMQV